MRKCCDKAVFVDFRLSAEVYITKDDIIVESSRKHYFDRIANKFVGKYGNSRVFFIDMPKREAIEKERQIEKEEEMKETKKELVETLLVAVEKDFMGKNISSQVSKICRILTKYGMSFAELKDLVLQSLNNVESKYHTEVLK